MRDIAAIAADLRRVVPIEYWALVDELVNYSVGQMATMEDIKEAQRERYSETLPTER